MHQRGAKAGKRGGVRGRGGRASKGGEVGRCCMCTPVTAVHPPHPSPSLQGSGTDTTAPSLPVQWGYVNIHVVSPATFLT